MIGWNIQSLLSTSSTNDDVLRAAERGEAEGYGVHAREQKKGRGRHGRVWDSPPGNLYCSLLLRPPCERRDFGHYAFAAALALGDTVLDYLPKAELHFKWPNDVFISGKKIAGILLESGDNYLVMGLGLNLQHHPEPALYPSTDLQTCGAEKVSSKDALERLLQHLNHWCHILRTEGFPILRAAWLVKAQRGHLTLKLPEQTIEGDFLDIDYAGHLRLKTKSGEEKVFATGDVFFAS